MFYVSGNPILADDLDVLNELKNQLAANGVNLFATFKQGAQNIQFNCPIHNNGQERKPSCGISTVNQRNEATGVVHPAGTVHCFTCGYTATLDVMVSHCFGRDDNGAFGKEWLLKNFLTVSVENRKDLNLDMCRKKVTDAVPTYITEEELDGYRYYHPYMYKRGLTNEIIEKFDVGYDNCFVLGDKKLKCVTFPVRDISGNTLFVARRCVDAKIFHYPQGVAKPVYGLYELPKDVREVIVCESVFNALTCYVYGRPAVALLGLGTGQQYEQLAKLRCRKLITAFDADEAGANATRRLKKALGGQKLITTLSIPPGKDVNDLTKKEFENLIEIF